MFLVENYNKPSPLSGNCCQCRLSGHLRWLVDTKNILFIVGGALMVSNRQTTSGWKNHQLVKIMIENELYEIIMRCSKFNYPRLILDLCNLERLIDDRFIRPKCLQSNNTDLVILWWCRFEYDKIANKPSDGNRARGLHQKPYRRHVWNVKLVASKAIDGTDHSRNSLEWLWNWIQCKSCSIAYRPTIPGWTASALAGRSNVGKSSFINTAERKSGSYVRNLVNPTITSLISTIRYAVDVPGMAMRVSKRNMKVGTRWGSSRKSRCSLLSSGLVMTHQQMMYRFGL